MNWIQALVIKLIIEKIINRTKNVDFKFDSAVSGSVVISLIVNRAVLLIRGLLFLYSFKDTNFTYVGKSIRVFNRKNMSIGKHVTIGDYVYLSALGKGELKIDSGVNIGSYTQLVISTSFNDIGKFIHIHENVAIGEFSYVGGAGGISIGKDTIIGQYFSAHPENHNYTNKDIIIRHQGVNRKGISIGENCWLGSKVTVLDGVTIGNNCVVTAGAVVTKSFPDGVMLGGVPAKMIKLI